MPVPKTPDRPRRENIFYSNAVSWIFTDNQEAVLDFKLVMPEDYVALTEKETKEEGLTHGSFTIDLDEVPVEVRIFMPFNQFEKLVERMHALWNKMQEAPKT